MNISPQVQEPESKKGSCFSIFLFVACIGWLIATSLGRNFSNMAASTSPSPASSTQELYAALIHAALLIAPLLLLSLRWSEARFRSVYQAWLWAAGSILLLAPVYLFEVDEAQAMAAAQIGIFSLIIGFLLIYRKNSARMIDHTQPDFLNEKQPAAWSWYLVGIIGLLAMLPWARNGAFGSLLDIALFSILAACLATVAILLIKIFILMPMRKQTRFTSGDYVITSAGIAGVLQILTAATVFPFGGMHLLLMMSLPITGWSLAALWMLSQVQADHSTTEEEQVGYIYANKAVWRGPAWLLLTLAASGPLLFIDADELAAVINMIPVEILHLALVSAGYSFLIQLIGALLLAGMLVWQIKRKNNQSLNFPASVTRLVLPASLLACIVLLGIVAYSSQPGLHAERMLVILKEQADVSMAKEIEVYSTRRITVYQELTTHAQKSQANIQGFLDKWRIAYTPYYLLNAIETIDSPLLRWYLLSRPEVDRILDSPRMRPLPQIEAIPLFQLNEPPPDETPWNLRMIHVDKVWEELGVYGDGIIIGQSDSGVQGDHPDLAGQYRGAGNQHDYNWFDPWNHSSAPVDKGGHGTHTLGTILGKRTGVAPQAQWIGCVNLARNMGNPALYLDCMQFMFAPFPQGGDPFTQGDPSLGAHVLNNSWGCPEFEGCDTEVFLPAVKALQAAGVFVAAGAGNDGPVCSSVSAPLPLYAEVFAVGAVDSQGSLASFSSLGPVTVDGSQRTKPDLVAPGVQVLSTLPGSTYGSFSGTSMAGPHVVGVVALLWSANPALIGDIETTQSILTQSAQPYTGDLPDCPGSNQMPSTAFGYGLLDAFAAVQMALQQP